MKAMFNGSSSIPIVQLSLLDTGNAKQAVKLGNALQSLRSALFEEAAALLTLVCVQG